MRKRTGLTVAIGVLAVAVGLGLTASWKQQSSRPEPLARSAPERTRPPLAVPARHPDGHLRIRGRVLGHGGPLAGVRISATRPRPGQTLSEPSCGPGCHASVVMDFVLAREGEAPVYAETSSAEDGSFTLDGLPAGSFTLWAAEARGASLWPDVEAGSEDLLLTLDTGVRLEGLVSGEDGVPLEGATVTAVHVEHTRFFDTETEAAGHFRLGPLPPGRYRLAVSKEGWLPKLAEGIEYQQVVLASPRRLVGRVLDAGRPVPGVQVRAAPWFPSGGEHETASPEHLATTDAEGRFTFEGLDALSYQLAASHGGQHATLRVEGDAFPPEALLELGNALRVEGSVRDEAGNPIAGARVSCSGHETVTDDEGHYQLGPMMPGYIGLRADASRYSSGSRQVESGPGTVRVDFTLAATLPIEGVVVDDAGQRLPGISLALQRIDEKGDLTRAVDVGSSDEEGRFLLGAPSPGTFGLAARNDDCHLREQTQVMAPSSDVLMVVPRRARVSGTFTDERGRPIAGASVKLWREGHELQATCDSTTDSRGRFSLWGLEPDRFVLEATHISGGVARSASRHVELRRHEPVEAALRLEAGWTLTGLAVDESGQPVPGVEVRPLLPEGATPAWRREETSFEPLPSAVTAMDGRFTLRHLQAEEIWLEVLAKEHRLEPTRSRGDETELQQVHVRSGTPEVRLVLRRLARIHGRLTGPDGAPLTRFTLNGQRLADPRGVFSHPIQRPGTFRMELSAKDMTPVTREVEAREDTDVDLGEIRLVPARRFSGRVLDAETGAPVEGAGVLAAREHIASSSLLEHPDTVRTDREGGFHLRFLEPGPLRLFVAADGYLPQQLALGEGDAEGLTVRLERGATLAFTVRDARGQPVDATLYLDRKGTPLTMRSHALTGGAGTVRGLEPGSYRLYASVRGAPPGTAVFTPLDVQVPSSGTVRLDLKARSSGATLELHGADASVSFPVLFPGVAPPQGPFRNLPPVEVRAFPFEGDFPGTVTYRNLPPGRATLLLVEHSVRGFHREELDLPGSGTMVLTVTPDWQPVVFDTL